MKPEDKKMMVRGYVVYSQNRCPCISLDAGKDESNWDCQVAYTTWYRHDDNLDELEKELDKLCRFYMSLRPVEGCMMGYEYKEYRR